MSFQPESTDKTIIDTNIKTARVLRRKKFTLTLSTSEATGISGYTTVDISPIDGNVGIQVVDVMLDFSGGGTTAYYKLPFTSNNTNGNINFSFYFSTTYLSTPSGGDNLVYIYGYSRSGSLNTAYNGTLIVYSLGWANPNDPESSY